MKILIVDDDSDVLDIVTFFVEDKFYGKSLITTAASGNEAIEKLKNDNFELCICDHNMPNGFGSDVLSYIKKNKLETKFVLCSSVTPSDMPNEYNKENLFFYIGKPEIEIGVEQLSKIFANEKNLVAEPSNYIPIMTNLLFIIGKLPCDVYLSLSEQKYLKCFNSGELFSEADHEKYLEKKITKLFVLKNEGEKELLGAINSSLIKIINNKKKPLDLKILETHTQLSSLLKIYGITEELSKIAQDSIKNVVEDIVENDKIHHYWLRLNLLGEYPSKLYTLQSMLCGVLSKKLTWCTPATLNKLVTAAFFQDLTLDSINLMMLVDYSDFLDKKDSFNSKEIENFCNHPLRAKNILAKMKNISPDVDRIILEQLEMPNGQGYPRKLGANQIGPLSAMFILTGIVSKYILRYDTKIDLELLFYYLEGKDYNKGNFKDIYNALKTILSE